MPNSNYPPNIHDFDDTPGSPFYVEADCCEKCDKVLEFNGPSDDDECHVCTRDFNCPFCKSNEVYTTETIHPNKEEDILTCKKCECSAPIKTWEEYDE